MRKQIGALLCALALAWTAAGAWAAVASYRLQVDGLACPFCAYGIEKKVGALEAVARVETHIKEGVVSVTMEDGASLDQATAKRAVEAAGFTLNGFEPVEAQGVEHRNEAMETRRFAALAACLVGLGGLSGAALAAPITFNTALPVAEGEFVFREQFFFIKSSDDPSPADRDLEVIGALSVLGFGVTGDLALFGALPVLDKSQDLDTPEGQRIERGDTGIGDAVLFGRYTAFRDDAPGRTFRIAPFVGLELPTGDEDERDGFGRLPQPLQLGSGSWDPFFGVVATWQTLDYQIDAQASYQVNTEANDFEFGNVLRFDASLQYRLWPRKLGPGVPGFLYGIVEANLIHQGENEIDGRDDPDSGGTALFLDPGLQYVTKRWVLEAIAQLPAVQELNGDALKNDYVVRAGFRVNF